MKKLPLLLITCCLWLLSFPVNAQQTAKPSIRGTVMDSTSGALTGATVLLLNAADSILVSFTTTGVEGEFELRKVSLGQYLLQITYLGYQTSATRLVLAENQDLQLDPIRLMPQSQVLDEVVVEAEHNPMTLKRDTIEFNAAAFKTQPNAVVEDLLKRLPGVEVENDGTIRAQGEEVERVLVDGKEFFGRDPQVATKNLPAESVDKVQVYDKKSDAAEFSGIDDGQREKTINLKLKEDHKKGVFGNASLGMGDMERFEGKVNLNKFSTRQQFSLIGMGNNVNQQGFSINDYINFSGGGWAGMGGGSMKIQINGDDNSVPLNMGPSYGFVNTWAGGLNFSQDFGSKTKLSSSYFYNRIDNVTDRSTRRQNFLSDRSFLSEEENNRDNLNANHRLNMTLEHQLDSLQSVKLTSSIGFNDAQQESLNASRVFGQDQSLQNDGDRLNTSGSENINLNANLLYRRRFQKQGRYFTANFIFGLNNTDGTGDLEAINNFYTPAFSSDTIRQNYLQENDRDNFGWNLSYTEPLGKRKYLTFSYDYQKNNSALNREVFDQPGPEGDPRFNSQLSNRYQSDYTYNRAGMNFKLNRKNTSFSTGLSWQHSALDGRLLLQEVDIDQSFVNWLPNMRLNYEITPSSNLSMDYETFVREPSLTQLQPVVDNSDPFNIYVGNPNLKTEYGHNLQMRFMSFNQFSMTNFFANLNFTYSHNRIQNAQTVDERFIRTTQPVNVDDDYNLRAMVNFGTPIRPIKSRISLNLSHTFNRGINFINEARNIIQRNITNVGLRLENRKKEVIDVAVGTRLSFNQTAYSINENLNEEFLNPSYLMEFTWYLPKGFTFQTDANYSVYNGRSNGFNDNVALWNLSLSKYLLKNDRGELTFAANDLLNQNVGITRRTDLNYIEDERIPSLARYFLLRFTYNLKSFGGGMQPGLQITTPRF